MRKLLLIDGYGAFYKSYFAFIKNPLKNQKGEETSVIYGFLNTFYKLLSITDYDLVIIALDSKGKTFRHDLDKNYKAQRPPMPDALKVQIGFLVKLLKDMGIPCINAQGFEADDIIGTYASTAVNEKIETFIFSTDKDLMQLINQTTQLIAFDQKTNQLVTKDAQSVKDKFLVLPENMIDYLALTGDRSDNIPGVQGIGPKSATKLVEDYKSLEQIYANLETIKNKSIQKKLFANKKNAFLSKKLVMIEKNMDSIPPLSSLNLKKINLKNVNKKLSDKECFNLLKLYQFPKENIHENIDFDGTLLELIKNPPKTTKIATKTPVFKRSLIKTKEDFDWFLTLAKKEKLIIFDLETTSLDSFEAKLIAVVFVFPSHLSFYLAFQTKTQNYLPIFLQPFKDLMEDESIKKIGHNLKYEYSILKEQNITLKGLAQDTMLREYIINPIKSHYNLENLIKQYFGIEKKNYQELEKEYESIWDIPEKDLETYTFEDGEYTCLLYQAQEKKLSEEITKPYYLIDIPLITVLAHMELEGVLIDSLYLQKISKEMSLELEEIEKKIHDLAEEEFNINSTKQLQKILFEKLAIKPVKKTKTGYSTDTDVLKKLSYKYPLANFLLKHRKFSKLLNTYINALPKMINPHTDKIHTSYSQIIAATGRLSSHNPNLQNIPIKTKEGRNIRKAFIAPKGYKVVSIDYSQVELRILAQLSKDTILLKAYENNQDIHLETASLLFKTAPEMINEDQRRIAKTINFSVIYGISAYALSEDLGITREEAKHFIDLYFEHYKKVTQYIQYIIEQTRKTLFVKTFYGRKRPVLDINASQFHIRSRAERIAFNNVIQGTAADIIKLSMIEIDQQIKRSQIKANMIMQIHDELVFYIKEEVLNETIKKISKCMTDVKPFEKILDVNITCEDYLSK